MELELRTSVAEESDRMCDQFKERNAELRSRDGNIARLRSELDERERSFNEGTTRLPP